MPKKAAEELIRALNLQPHPEGGYFKETYRSSEGVSGTALPERFSADRSFCTAIYFLLSGEDVSHFHRIKSDELWHFYQGGALLIHCLSQQGEFETLRLGEGSYQKVVPAGSWFASELEDKSSYALVGCTVSPGFDFADFEMAAPGQLSEILPDCADLLDRLTLKS